MSAFWRLEAFISAWCVKNVDASPSPVAFCVQLILNALLLLHVLSISTRTKACACISVRLQCRARARCLFSFRLLKDWWCSIWKYVPCISPHSHGYLGLSKGLVWYGQALLSQQCDWAVGAEILAESPLLLPSVFVWWCVLRICWRCVSQGIHYVLRTTDSFDL